jgi:hypothetical protein
MQEEHAALHGLDELGHVLAFGHQIIVVHPSILSGTACVSAMR